MISQVPAGDSNVTVTLHVDSSQIKLWWPAGSGEQTMYNVTAALTSVSPDAKLTETK